MSAYNKYRSVIPSFMIKDASNAIEYYKDVFNAKELYRANYKNKIIHSELLIGNSIIMLSDEMEMMKDDVAKKTCLCKANQLLNMYIYVENVDKVFNRAIETGGKIYYPIENHFYGDRSGSFTDPFGIIWTVATHIEDVSVEELNKRMPIAMEKMIIMNQSDDIYKEKYQKYKKKYIDLKKRN